MGQHLNFVMLMQQEKMTAGLVGGTCDKVDLG